VRELERLNGRGRHAKEIASGRGDVRACWREDLSGIGNRGGVDHLARKRPGVETTNQQQAAAKNPRHRSVRFAARADASQVIDDVPQVLIGDLAL